MCVFTYKQCITPLPCCFMSVQHFFVSFRFTCLILLRTTFFHFKLMWFYLLWPFCASWKPGQFAVPGSFLSYLNELGFGFASLFYLQIVLFIIIVRGSSLPLSFYEDFSFLLCVWRFHLPSSSPLPAQPRQACCLDTVSAEVAAKDVRTSPALCKNTTETGCDRAAIAICNA